MDEAAERGSQGGAPAPAAARRRSASAANAVGRRNAPLGSTTSSAASVASPSTSASRARVTSPSSGSVGGARNCRMSKRWSASACAISWMRARAGRRAAGSRGPAAAAPPDRRSRPARPRRRPPTARVVGEDGEQAEPFHDLLLGAEVRGRDARGERGRGIWASAASRLMARACSVPWISEVARAADLGDKAVDVDAHGGVGQGDRHGHGRGHGYLHGDPSGSPNPPRDGIPPGEARRASARARSNQPRAGV